MSFEIGDTVRFIKDDSWLGKSGIDCYISYSDRGAISINANPPIDWEDVYSFAVRRSNQFKSIRMLLTERKRNEL